jgi:putative NADH-flavin reductase
MNIAIFGANGPTGRLLCKQALEAGHHVTAVTRHPETFDIAHERLAVLTGDALDLDAVRRAVTGRDAVLSTLGVPYGRKPISLYSESTANLVTAMDQAGVRRLVVVSSSATDPQERFRDTGGGFFFEKVLKPMITLTMGKTLYDDMRRMEERLRASDLDWTIMRPSGLFATETVTDYRIQQDFIAGRYTSRADLAAAMLEQLSTDDHLRKAVAVATFSEQPSVLQLIRAEALRQPSK